MFGFSVDWTWTPTSIVAVYAALVSTFAFGVSIINLLRDRINVVLHITWSIVQNSDGSQLGPFYAFRVSNFGRRTVTLSNYGFLAKDRKGRKMNIEFNPYYPPLPSISLSELPFELDEGKSKSLFVIPEKAREGLRDQFTEPPRKAYVDDVISRRWTCKIPTRMRDEMWGDASYRPWWRIWEQGWWPI